MEFIYAVVFLAYVIIFFLLIGIMIFGNAECCKGTCFASIYHFFATKLPQSIEAKARKVLKMRPASEDRHGADCAGRGGPCRYFVMIFFMILYGALVFDFFKNTYRFLPLLHNRPLFYQFLAIVLPCIPWIVVLSLQFMDPGVITAENVEGYLKKYPYDNIVYKEKICPTDKIPVVPRSRYCNYSRKRVAKYDHYCPWVLVPIGERNHRYFLLFLIACIVASTYYCINDVFVVFFYFMQVYQRIPWTNSFGRNLILFVVVILKLQSFNAVCIILFIVIIITLVVFVIQQLYNISRNITSIEEYKYEKAQEEMDKKAKKGHKKIVPNIYDHGLISNWIEFLFPTRVPKGEPWKPDKTWQKRIDQTENKKNE